jgi:hypothetical protein
MAVNFDMKMERWKASRYGGSIAAVYRRGVIFAMKYQIDARNPYPPSLPPPPVSRTIRFGNLLRRKKRKKGGGGGKKNK